LLGASYRVKYKASKLRRYWPKESPSARMVMLLDIWAKIIAALSERIDGIRLDLPKPESGCTLGKLKRFEDAIDALICAWVAVEYLEGRACPYGDETAAIWVPTSGVHSAPLEA
jgi:predicted RNase H-like nuclease